jgi:hypothetical protein
MGDLNQMLSNFAVTAAARAAAHRRDAAECRSRTATGWAEYDSASERAARRSDREAARWDSVAEHAKRGLLLTPVDDALFQMEHRALIDEAASGGRVVSVES